MYSNKIVNFQVYDNFKGLYDKSLETYRMHLVVIYLSIYLSIYLIEWYGCILIQTFFIFTDFLLFFYFIKFCREFH